MSHFSSQRWGTWRLMSAAVAIALLAAAYAAENNQGNGSEEEAVRQCVESYVAAYNRHDAEAVAALWSESGEWVSPTGEHFKGREAIAKELKAIFDASEGLRIEVSRPTIRLVTSDVAMEEGTVRVFSASAAPSDSTYIAIHVKKDGQWRLDSVRETELTETPAASALLQDLAWLVGEWGDADAASQTSVKWTKNKTFLSYSFKIAASDMDDLEGTQVIGWDPVAKTIRSWMFDSDGGFGEGVWSKKGDSWVVKFSQVLADGRTASSTNIYTPLDSNSFTWKAIGRQVAGEYLPNMEELKITRKHAGDAEVKSVTEKKGSKAGDKTAEKLQEKSKK